MKYFAILFLLATTVAANTNDIEPIYLEEEGLHCFTEHDYHLVLDKIQDGTAAAANSKDLEEIIDLQRSLLNKYRVKSSLSIAGGILAVAGSALLLSGQEDLKKGGAVIAITGLVSMSVGIAW